jgi:hypothetical protein
MPEPDGPPPPGPFHADTFAGERTWPVDGDELRRRAGMDPAGNPEARAALAGDGEPVTLEAAVRRLREQLGRLSAMLEHHEAVLSPALRPEPALPGDAEPPTEHVTTMLAGEVRQAAEVAANIAGRLGRITGRLDLELPTRG